MTDDGHSTDRVQVWIERLAAGDEQACAELINHAAARLASLTEGMFQDYRRLGRWEQTEDVCQNASVRLWNALKSTRPTTPAEFYRLAALQIRRELIDQIRRHFGPEDIGANLASNAWEGDSTSPRSAAYDRPQSTHDPAKLSGWVEFHEQVALLPEDERSAFDLIYYQGLAQAEAAAILGISERTLKRRWLSARLTVGKALEGAPP